MEAVGDAYKVACVATEGWGVKVQSPPSQRVEDAPTPGEEVVKCIGRHSRNVRARRYARENCKLR